MQKTVVALPEVVRVLGVGKSVSATQMERKGDLCLYLRTDGIFEVFYVNIQPEKKLPSGKWYPRRESYPSNEDFGSTAWCFTSIDNAKKKFDEEYKRQETPSAPPSGA